MMNLPVLFKVFAEFDRLRRANATLGITVFRSRLTVTHTASLSAGLNAEPSSTPQRKMVSRPPRFQK
jgi:hypothetical protein